MQNRKFLTKNEIEKLLNAAKLGPYPERDYCLILMSYLHGLRVSELSNLTISNIDLVQKIVYIKRLKNGLSTIQPLHQTEISAIKIWLDRRQYLISTDMGRDHGYLFISPKRQPLSRYQIYRLTCKYGKLAKLNVKVHPHMLRHACGYALADLGRDTRLIQDYLGHRNIAHTVIYTASNEKRFNRIWEFN